GRDGAGVRDQRALSGRRFVVAGPTPVVPDVPPLPASKLSALRVHVYGTPADKAHPIYQQTRVLPIVRAVLDTTDGAAAAQAIHSARVAILDRYAARGLDV